MRARHAAARRGGPPSLRQQQAAAPTHAPNQACGTALEAAAAAGGSARQAAVAAAAARRGGGAAPASVPISRILLLKVMTLGVSRLLSLLRITSTPAGSQGAPEGRRSAAAAAAGACSGAAAGTRCQSPNSLPSIGSPTGRRQALRRAMPPNHSPPLRARAMHDVASPTSMPAHAMVLQPPQRTLPGGVSKPVGQPASCFGRSSVLVT